MNFRFQTHLITVGTHSMLAVLDVNGDEQLNVGDIVYTAQFLFNGGPDPIAGTDCFPALAIGGCAEICTP